MNRENESLSLLLWRRRMVFTTAMETRNDFHYCYGDNESFSLQYIKYILQYIILQYIKHNIYDIYFAL